MWKVAAVVTLALCGLPVSARSDIFDDHRNLMIGAISTNDEPRVKALLKTPYVNVNDDISSTSLSASSYLILASRNCKLNVVLALLEAGANPNYVSPQEMTALGMALIGGAPEHTGDCTGTVLFLLMYDADPNLEFNAGTMPGPIRLKQTPLLATAMNCGRAWMVPVARLLRQFGGDPNYRFAYDRRGVRAGGTPLHAVAAFSQDSRQPYPDGCLTIARYLARSGPRMVPVDFTITDAAGATAVDVAASNCVSRTADPALHKDARDQMVALFTSLGAAAPKSGNFCSDYFD